MVQSSFINNLYKLYGTDRATPATGGEYAITPTGLHTVEFKIDLTTQTETETILDNGVFIPAGVRIQEVEVITHTVAATGVAIDLGLIKASDRATEVDYNGLLAAFPLASMDAAGEKTTLVSGSSFVGALVGTDTAFISMVSASRTTATAFTTGLIYVKIRFYRP